MANTDTVTIEKTTEVQVPVTEDRKAQTYNIIVNFVGEVQFASTDAKEADVKLAELAQSRSGQEFPRLFLIQGKGIPTDAELLAAKD